VRVSTENIDKEDLRQNFESVNTMFSVDTLKVSS
jgi:hypothetical protein